MAKTTGVIGGLSGKLGSAVFAHRRGVQIARAYQPVVANPKSERQQLSRAKFALAESVSKGLREFVRMGWQKTKPTYQIQQAVGIMVPAGNGIITIAGDDSLEVQYTELRKALSANLINAPSNKIAPDFTQESQVSGTLLLPASCFVDEHGDVVDCAVVICVYSTDLNQSVVARVIATRPTGGETEVEVSYAVAVPSVFAGTMAYVYAFAKQIPTAYNGIATTVWPWKFPSNTSETMTLGAGDIS